MRPRIWSTPITPSVALKMIRPGLAALDDLVDRIHAEVQLAHRITHPNVCNHSLHVDWQPQGNRLFLIMDFLEGETLRERLARTGPLDTATASAVRPSKSPQEWMRHTGKASSTRT